jgi:hypothetical protein
MIVIRLFLGTLALLVTVGSLAAQTRRNDTVDLENRNPAVGSLSLSLRGRILSASPRGSAASVVAP